MFNYKRLHATQTGMGTDEKIGGKDMGMGPGMGTGDQNSYCYMALIGANPDLVHLQNLLKFQVGEDGGNFPDPESFHITLVYATGDNPGKYATPYSSLAFSVLVDGLGVFDTPDGYAVHATIRPCIELITVQADLAAQTVSSMLTLSPFSEPANYTPHITLGYLKNNVQLPTIESFPLKIDWIVLSGSDYETLARYDLKALPEKYAHIDFKPTAEMQAAARRALQVRANKTPSQRGMTAVGIARARDIIRGVALSPDTWKRMYSFFSRHEVDKRGKKWDSQGEGWQAWNGWGGDPGYARARKIVRQIEAADRRNKAWGEGEMMEYKSTPMMVQDVTDRTVTGYAAICGNIDDGGDQIRNGAFKKTLMENAKRVRVLWQHKMDEPPTAVLRDIQEVDRAELPDEIKQRFPMATGGLKVVREYLDTPRGEEVLKGIKAGAIGEMSIGYAPTKGGVKYENYEGKQVRCLHELKLYEVSDVNIAMNPAAFGNTKTILAEQLSKMYDMNELAEAASEFSMLLDVLLTGQQLSGDDLSAAKRVVDKLTAIMPAESEEEESAGPLVDMVDLNAVQPESGEDLPEDRKPEEKTIRALTEGLLMKLAIMERDVL